MGDGHHSNFLTVDEVSDVVRKDFEIDPPVSVGSNPGQPGMVGNPIGGRSHLFFETGPETGFNAFIARDGIG